MESIIGDEVPPEVRERVRALLYDLASNDLSMALLDLAQLHRFLGSVVSEPLPGDPPGTINRRLCQIYAEDGRTTVELCAGPDRAGRCTRTSAGSPVPCAGRWIMARGWRFRIAPDAQSCPLVELGLIHLLPQAPANEITLYSARVDIARKEAPM